MAARVCGGKRVKKEERGGVVKNGKWKCCPHYKMVFCGLCVPNMVKLWFLGLYMGYLSPLSTLSTDTVVDKHYLLTLLLIYYRRKYFFKEGGKKVYPQLSTLVDCFVDNIEA